MAMLPVAASFVAILLALIGWAELAISAAGAHAKALAQEFSLGDRGLLGLVLLAGAGQVLQFLVPLSSSVAVAFLGIGLLSCALLGRRVLARPAARGFLPLAGLASLTQALTDKPAPDAGIYYVPSVLWNTQLPLVPGLGNVQGRLAYNSTEFVLAALFKLPGVDWDSAFLVNAFLGLCVLLALFEHLGASLRAAERITLAPVFAFVLLIAWCAHHFYVSGSLGSLSTDFPAAMLVPYAAYLVLLAFDSGRGWPLTWAVVLACLAVTIKLAALPLLIGLGGVLVFASVSRRLTDTRALTLAAGSAVALLAPWMARSLLLSGCLVYPVRMSCATSLPWAVRPELTAHEAQYIVDYARGTIATPASVWDWVAPELTELAGNHIGRLVLLLLAAGVVLLAIAPRGRLSGRPRELVPSSGAGLYWCAAVLGLGIVFSLAVAPALRFSLGSWYALGSLALATGLVANAARAPQPGWGRRVPLCLCGLMSLQCGMVGWTFLHTPPTPRVAPVVATLMTTQSALMVYVPPDEACQAAPLPCTPYFDATLREVPFSYPLGQRFYFQGSNTIAYRNLFPARDQVE
jgi:hypothetical protein